MKKVKPAAPPIPPLIIEDVIWPRCRQLLTFLKRGKPVESLMVFLTHENVHQIHQSTLPRAKQLREQYPLELVLAKGMDMERKIDARKFTVQWRIPLPATKAPRLTPPVVEPATASAPVESEFLPSPEGHHGTVPTA